MRRGLTPLWKLHRNPKIHVSRERNTEVAASAPDEDLGPGTDCRGILRGPSQLAWRLDFPEYTRAGPGGPQRNSRGNPSFLPQLKKNKEILPSMRDEALFCCGVSREIPHSLFRLKRVLDILEATQEVPRISVSTREEHRGSSHLKKNPIFPSSSRVGGPFPCFFRKGIPKFPSHLKRRRSQLEIREELQGSCHHFKRS